MAIEIGRRKFIFVLGGTVVAWPLAVRAQQTLPVVGFLRNSSLEGSADFAAAFRRGLQDEGFVDGQNVAIAYGWTNGQADRLPVLAAQLAHRPVTVLMAGGNDAIKAAKAATTTIPIVFAAGDDPIRLGFVTSLNHPGGNLTGASFLTASALARKRFEFPHMLAPKATDIGFLVNPSEPAAVLDANETAAAAGTFGLQVHVLHASSERDLEPAFAELAQQHIGALVIGGDPLFMSQRNQIAELAMRNGLPTASSLREYVAAGCLMSYGPAIVNAFHQAGVYAGRILKGARPADLPIVLPTKFDLVINLKTAKALGLEVPNNLLALADEVIE